MKRTGLRLWVGSLASLALAAGLASGCGPDKVTLQEAPPVKIEPPRKDSATSDRNSLKSGAPAKGSSSGMSHNPSETPR